jgi:hypothetical protein
VDLVEEEDRALAVRAEPLAGPRDRLAHLRHRRGDGRELLERRAGRVRDDARERRLAAARRAVEDGRADAVALDRQAERRTGAEHVLLADELLERPRAQPDRERRDLGQPLARRIGEKVCHAGSMLGRP